jgi:hypothetical protein
LADSHRYPALLRRPHSVGENVADPPKVALSQSSFLMFFGEEITRN